ncbi:tripartite tricarboxylate transporter TctB family protein [Oceanobacillus jeddahense]|uniref:tripartite tricarboxylate transporter TctB family protein n=1 Tax=Oceanobacillus jeddahense TaxID=1462527 RepID=UPI000595F00A|nr:tripartite tricarboxylate transporter TctB family protein [Oceanobacillus jeddahense]
MSYKMVNILFSLFLLILTSLYLIQSIGFITAGDGFISNPGFYPMILASIVLILSIFKLIQTIVKKDKENKEVYFKVENLKYILLTILITIAYVLLWYTIRDLFYIFTFLFFLSLATLYSYARKIATLKTLLRNAIVSLVVTIIIFLIFDLLFSIRF